MTENSQDKPYYSTSVSLLHFTFALDPKLAGVARSIPMFCENTSEFGIDNFVASFGNSKQSKVRGLNYFEMLVKSGTKVYVDSSPFSNEYGIGTLRSVFKFFKSVPEIDVIIVHQLYTLSTIWGWILSRKRKLPLIMFPHGTLTSYHENDSKIRKYILKRLILGRVLRDCDLFVATSYEEVKEIRNFTQRRVVCIPYGFKIENTQREICHKLNPNLLFIGRFTKKKNIDSLIASIGLLASQYPQIKLRIVGYQSNAEYEKYRRVSKQHHVDPYIDFEPWSEQSILKSWYQKADIFVLPSDNENYGQVVADALSFGLPCVVTDKVALSEVISRRDAGIIIPDASPSTIAEGIKACLDISYENRCHNALKLTKSELSWSSVANAWKNEIRGLK